MSESKPGKETKILSENERRLLVMVDLAVKAMYGNREAREDLEEIFFDDLNAISDLKILDLARRDKSFNEAVVWCKMVMEESKLSRSSAGLKERLRALGIVGDDQIRKLAETAPPGPGGGTFKVGLKDSIK